MYQEELKAEAAGLTYTEYMQQKDSAKSEKKRKNAPSETRPAMKKSKKEAQEAEKKELAKMMMSKKDRRLYEQIQFGKNKKAAITEKLKEKREKIKKRSGWNVAEK